MTLRRVAYCTKRFVFLTGGVVAISAAVLAASLVDATPAFAAPVWSKPGACVISGRHDYSVRTGWVRNGSGTQMFYDVTKWTAVTGIGLAPLPVYSLDGFELYQPTIAQDTETAFGFSGTRNGTVYFPGSMTWMSRARHPMAKTYLYTSNWTLMCSVTTYAPV